MEARYPTTERDMPNSSNDEARACDASNVPSSNPGATREDTFKAAADTSREDQLATEANDESPTKEHSPTPARLSELKRFTLWETRTVRSFTFVLRSLTGPAAFLLGRLQYLTNCFSDLENRQDPRKTKRK